MTPESLADLFRQLAFISALVGGFAFAFLGTLLTSPSTKPYRFVGIRHGPRDCSWTDSLRRRLDVNVIAGDHFGSSE